MPVNLTRAMVETQIDQLLQGKLPARTLAAWAFDQACDEEEGLVQFESGFTEAISTVLDDLMWVDDARFHIDHDTAQQLKARLHDEQTNAQGRAAPLEPSQSEDG